MIEQDLSSIPEFQDCPANIRVICSPFPKNRLDGWESWLRDDELQRVSNYRRQVDRQLFVARRGLARESIARMRTIQPSSIYFSIESMGKLQWASDDLDPQSSTSIRKLDFSISRSSGIVAMAGCESVQVGVDIETICSLPELEMLAMLSLHPNELQVWSTIPRADRTIAFYQSWVVKEAFAKALGVGLTQAPRSVDSTQALVGLEHGTVAVDSDESQRCTGRFWMTAIAQTRRIAVVIT